MTLRILDNLEQGSEAWHDQRRGMVTASVVGSLLSVGKPGAIAYDCTKCPAKATNPCVGLRDGKPLKTLHPERAAVAKENEATAPLVIEVANNETSRSLTKLLVAERITGWSDPVYVSDDMLRGTLDEPVAREAYAKHYAPAPVTEVGFMVRTFDSGAELGFSPDGLVGEEGLLEVKSRRPKKQLSTVLAGKVPAENMAQAQAGLLVSGRKWLDFVSFAGGMHLWVQRVFPDERWFEAITAAVNQFERTAEEMVSIYFAEVEGRPMTERTVFDDEVIV